MVSATLPRYGALLMPEEIEALRAFESLGGRASESEPFDSQDPVPTSQTALRAAVESEVAPVGASHWPGL